MRFARGVTGELSATGGEITPRFGARSSSLLSAGGAAALKALGGPYKDVRFMPTGGVTQANLPSYLSLPGVFAAGGTWLVPAEAVAKRDWAAVEALTRAAVQAAAEAS